MFSRSELASINEATTALRGASSASLQRLCKRLDDFIWHNRGICLLDGLSFDDADEFTLHLRSHERSAA